MTSLIIREAVPKSSSFVKNIRSSGSENCFSYQMVMAWYDVRYISVKVLQQSVDGYMLQILVHSIPGHEQEVWHIKWYTVYNATMLQYVKRRKNH